MLGCTIFFFHFNTNVNFTKRGCAISSLFLLLFIFELNAVLVIFFIASKTDPRLDLFTEVNSYAMHKHNSTTFSYSVEVLNRSFIICNNMCWVYEVTRSVPLPLYRMDRGALVCWCSDHRIHSKPLGDVPRASEWPTASASPRIQK